MLALIKVFLFLVLLFVIILVSVRALYRVVRVYFLSRRKHEFGCFKCGKCCTLRVEPTEEDTKRMESLGYKRIDFMDGKCLKKVKGKCTFLKRQGKYYVCSVHEHKPRVCREWPFTGIFRGRFVYSKTFSCPAIAKFLEKK
jgi:Fe-S-cluster containining protein